MLDVIRADHIANAVETISNFLKQHQHNTLVALVNNAGICHPGTVNIDYSDFANGDGDGDGRSI